VVVVGRWLRRRSRLPGPGPPQLGRASRVLNCKRNFNLFQPSSIQVLRGWSRRRHVASPLRQMVGRPPTFRAAGEVDQTLILENRFPRFNGHLLTANVQLGPGLRSASTYFVTRLAGRLARRLKDLSTPPGIVAGC